jgi:hypothetical protein
MFLLFFLDIFAALKLNAALNVFLRWLEVVRLDHLGDLYDNDFKGGQLDAYFDESLDEGALVHAEDLSSQVPHEDALEKMEKVECQGVDC